jgi:prepilin-type processing-associated H-X9-DG protein
MYKIIGADQKEYGPVTADQIKQWIAQGRVNALTKAQAQGGEWKTLSQFPEFAVAFGNRATSSAVPPALSAVTSQPITNSGLAIASLVLGLVGLFTCGLTAIVGLILGIVSLSQIKKSNGTITGQGIALAGTIVSALFLLMIPIGAALFIPALAKAKGRALQVQCMNNTRQLGIATFMYASAHTNQLPAASNWCDSLLPFVGSTNVFQCPATTNDSCGYAFNTNLSGMNRLKINPRTVLIFESDGGWNASGGPELMLSQSRHERTFTVVFVDGHAEFVTPTRLAQLRWNP